jgi:inosose dehydratase
MTAAKNSEPGIVRGIVSEDRDLCRRSFLQTATAAWMARSALPGLLAVGVEESLAAKGGQTGGFAVKIGLQKAGWGDTPLADFFAAARELGYQGVELAPPWLEKEGYSLDDVDRLLEKSGATLAAATFVGGGSELRDPGARKAYQAKARKYARWINSHGGKYLIYSTVGYSNPVERRHVFSAYDAVADAVAEEGCVPLYHNHFNESHPQSQRYLEEDLDALDWSRWKLCVDTGHLVLALTDPVQFIKQWADKVRWMHCKDVKSSDVETLSRVRWSKNFTTLGTGVVDFPAILKQLASVGYESWLVVEQDNTPDPVATSERSITYLKNILSQM